MLICDSSRLLILNFIDSNTDSDKNLINVLSGCSLIDEVNDVSTLVIRELEKYFNGELRYFTTPTMQNGTAFQIEARGALLGIRYGSTMTYKDQAQLLGRAKSYRAVASANASNPILIIYPCHRVISSNSDKICGYRGGVDRKKWLLNHEARHKLTTLATQS
jgi:O-6-methylguanine DNA methyltransferase